MTPSTTNIDNSGKTGAETAASFRGIRFFRSVRGKYYAILIPAIFLCYVLFSLVFAFFFYHKLEMDFSEKIRNVLEMQATALTIPVWNYDIDTLKAGLTSLILDPDVKRAAVFDSNGKLLAQAGRTSPATGIFHRRIRRRRQIEYQTPYTEKTIGVLEIEFHNDRLRREVIDDLKRTSVLVLFLTGALVAGAALAHHLIVGRPLKRFYTAIRRAQTENRLIPVDWRSCDEIGVVIHAYNRLLTSLAEEKRALSKNEKQLLRYAVDIETAKQQAESANLAKSAFLANMSHEIRTPLNAILGFAEILEEQNQNPALTEYIKTIRISGDALLAIINDILDISKIEAGKLELDYTPVRIRPLFEEIQNIFTPKTAGKHLEFHLDIDPETPECLLMDGTRIRQVLLNLVGNAVKFTESGYIQIQVTARPHAETDTKTDFMFSVTDTGIGIPADQMSDIFGTFRQARRGDPSRYGGTGLGLAITKRLLEIMNGDIGVESMVGQGTVFRVTIGDVVIVSAKSPDEKEKTDIDLKSVQFEPAGILIADDVEANRKLVRDFLAGYPFRILEANDGESVVQAVSEDRPDLILMDIKMPVINGIDATRIIRKMDPDIPVIALTADAMKDSEDRIRRICDGYLRKPIQKAALIAEMARFLAAVPTPSPKPPQAASELETCEITEPPDNALIIALEDRRGLWQTIRKTLSINDIESFGEEIKTLGAAYRCPLLEHWGETLRSRASDFDIDAMTDVLDGYPDVVEKLKPKEKTVTNTDQ
jgi:two-component system sensor histidine kinase EvgS